MSGQAFQRGGLIEKQSFDESGPQMKRRMVLALLMAGLSVVPAAAVDLELGATYGVGDGCKIAASDTLGGGMATIGGDSFRVAGVDCKAIQSLPADGGQVATMVCTYASPAKTTIEQFRIVKIGSDSVDISNAAGKVLGRLTRCL